MGSPGVSASDVENYQQQVEELVALQSIYGDDFRVLSLSSGCEEDVDPEELLSAASTSPPLQLACEAFAHVDVPASGLTLQLLASSQQGAEGQASSSQAQQGGPGKLMAMGMAVSHLPPICIRLSFPPSYPSTCPPTITLNAMWLSPEHMASITSALHTLWQEQGPGLPVCFTWIDWVQHSVLEHLHIQDTLIVHPHVMGGADNRSVALSPDEASSPLARTASGPSRSPHPVACPAEEVAVNLVRYSLIRDEELFQVTFVSCSICFDDVLGANCVRLRDCRHFTCRKCFSQHCKTLIEDGQVDNIRCTEPSCRAPVAPDVVRIVVSEEEYARWESLLLQRTLDRMEDVVYCPRCEAICLKDKDDMGQCPACFYVFCAKCDMGWHPGEPCISGTAKLEMEAARKKREGMSQEERRRIELDLLNQMQSLKLLEKTTKNCPSCHMGIEKTEGCNKMHCNYCSTYFCWRCREMNIGYDHFGAGKCSLFEQAEIDRWNRQFELGPRAQEVEAAAFRARFMLEHHANARPALCPSCGQINVKENGNNNIRCWGCNSNFCALCRMRLGRKPGLHFGPSGCKQHTIP
mmetsp:Transcript_27251/g.59541  ORF Transcript_27251/g.59541 Transcript_27251/m.59541 type:complete len:579 (-) Transcript_27251:897-2633(-)